MKTIRWYFPKANDLGISEHPQQYLQKLGFKIHNFEGVPIADCVIMQIEGDFTKLPECVYDAPDFKFK